MTNPINPNGNSLARNTVGSVNTGAEKAASNSTSSSNTNQTSEDTVSLSQGSQQVIELQQKLINTPEIDSAKVEAIKQEIAKGNYPLDPEKIADNLINLEQSLIK